MAVFIASNALLRTRVQIGTSAGGSPILRSCAYNGVSPSVAADDLIAVSQALGTLIDYPIVETQFSQTDLVA
ncbi:MAG: DUF1659 domain-containing protein [Thermovirgaceae bacterium]|nr:DUF1659 domain-containing protein [Thermovirgaceae bacterium]